MSKQLVAVAATTALVAEFRQPAVPAKRQRPKRKVLDEDSFVHSIERIVERDFYPDLPKLRAQHEYLTALENNDTDRLRELSIRYQTDRVNGPSLLCPFPHSSQRTLSLSPQLEVFLSLHFVLCSLQNLFVAFLLPQAPFRHRQCLRHPNIDVLNER